MNRDEFIAESKRLQKEIDCARRIRIFSMVVALVAAAVALIALLTACQVPLR
jgi:hypothetical protein